MIKFWRLILEGIALSQRAHHPGRVHPLYRQVQAMLEERGRPSVPGLSRNPYPKIRTNRERTFME